MIECFYKIEMFVAGKRCNPNAHLEVESLEVFHKRGEPLRAPPIIKEDVSDGQLLLFDELSLLEDGTWVGPVPQGVPGAPVVDFCDWASRWERRGMFEFWYGAVVSAWEVPQIGCCGTPRLPAKGGGLHIPAV